jgi:hypothetical protein
MGMGGSFAFLDQFVQVIEDFLGPAHGKGGDDHIPALLEGGC